MALATTRWDAAEYLKTDEDIRLNELRIPTTSMGMKQLPLTQILTLHGLGLKLGV